MSDWSAAITAHAQPRRRHARIATLYGLMATSDRSDQESAQMSGGWRAAIGSRVCLTRMNFAQRRHHAAGFRSKQRMRTVRVDSLRRKVDERTLD